MIFQFKITFDRQLFFVIAGIIHPLQPTILNISFYIIPTFIFLDLIFFLHLNF